MDPVTASILLSAGTNLAGFGLKRFLGSGRPDYEIPDSARQALNLARIHAADPNMPGEQKAIERAGVSAANSARVAQESGNALEALPSIQGQYDATTQGILARSEADQKADQQRLAQQLAQMAQYEDMRYQMNEYAPYAEKQQETRDLVGSLSTNLSSALLHQGLSADGAGATSSAPNFLANVGDAPASTMSDAPAPLSVPPTLPSLNSKVVAGQMPVLPQKGFKVTTNADAGTEDYDVIRLLLNRLEKQPTAYPY